MCFHKVLPVFAPLSLRHRSVPPLPVRLHAAHFSQTLNNMEGSSVPVDTAEDLASKKKNNGSVSVSHTYASL